MQHFTNLTQVINCFAIYTVQSNLVYSNIFRAATSSCLPDTVKRLWIPGDVRQFELNSLRDKSYIVSTAVRPRLKVVSETPKSDRRLVTVTNL